MQGIERNGYSRAEVLAALQGRTGSRRWTFRYDLFTKANVYLQGLDNVESGSVSLNNLAEIKRTAKFRVTDDGTINFLSDRIKPYARLAMPAETDTYADVLATARNQLLRWKLDEVVGSVANDASGNPVYNGSIPATGVSLGRPGLLDGGSSMLFASGNTGITTSAAWLNGKDRLTLVAWVRNDGSLPAVRTIVGGTGGLVLGYTHLTGSTVPQTIRFQVPTDHGTVLVEAVAGTQAQGLQCIVATWTAGLGARLYVNGERVQLASTTLPLAAALTSGITTFTVGAGWIGAIDDVSVFADSVSDDQARAIYQSGVKIGAYGRDNWVEWPLGLFLLSSPTRSRTRGGVIRRNVDAYDQLLVYAEDKVADRYTVAAGVLYTEEVRTLLAQTPAKFITNSLKTLPTAREWEPGTSKLQIINDLLDAINYRSLTFDEDGTAIVAPYTSPADRPVEYTFKDDETSVISPDMEQTLDVFSIPNKWVLVVSDPDRGALMSSYTNQDPTSLTSTVSRGRTITDFRTEQDAADQATLDAKVARLAFEASQVYEEVPFETGIMPIMSADDVYQLTYSGLAISAKYSGVSWELPLKAGAMMKHTARRVVQV